MTKHFHHVCFFEFHSRRNLNGFSDASCSSIRGLSFLLSFHSFHFPLGTRFLSSYQEGYVDEYNWDSTEYAIEHSFTKEIILGLLC